MGHKFSNYEIIKYEGYTAGTDCERNYINKLVLRSKIDPQFRLDYPATAASAMRYKEQKDPMMY